MLIIFVASLVPLISDTRGQPQPVEHRRPVLPGHRRDSSAGVGALFLTRRMSPAPSPHRIAVHRPVRLRRGILRHLLLLYRDRHQLRRRLPRWPDRSLLLLASTVCAQWIPALAADFAGRPSSRSPWQRATPSLPLRPAAPKPVPGGAPRWPAGRPPGQLQGCLVRRRCSTCRRLAEDAGAGGRRCSRPPGVLQLPRGTAGAPGHRGRPAVRSGQGSGSPAARTASAGWCRPRRARATQAFPVATDAPESAAESGSSERSRSHRRRRDRRVSQRGSGQPAEPEAAVEPGGAADDANAQA